MSRIRSVLLLLGVLIFPSVGHAADRVALVIGNGDYRHAVALPNPRNDADDVSGLLEGLGFHVVRGSDLTRSGMEDAIRQFAIESASASTVLFFYAGHGMQVNGRNYLIPVDAELAERTALDFEAVDVEKVFRYMTGSDKVALAFLDACRNNPLSRNFTRALGPTRSATVGDGLAPTTTSGSGLFIAYATAPNDVAQDGDGRNSPFTSALLRHLPTQDAEIQQVMTRVKADVRRTTNGAQRPWHNSDLSSEVYLARAATDTAQEVVRQPASQTDADAVLWSAVKDSGDAGLLRLFLDRFPQSRFAVEAERKVAALEDVPQRPDFNPTEPPVAVRRCRQLTEILVGNGIVDVGERRIRPRDIIESCEAASTAAPKDADIAYRLAEAYSNIDDYKAYEAALVRASELGSLQAKARLGWAWGTTYSNLAYDPDRGLQMLLEVADQTSAAERMAPIWAMDWLKSQYQYGPDHIKDEEKRRYWYDRSVDAIKAAVEDGDTDAMYSLGYKYMYGDGPRILADPGKARELFEDALAKGHIWSLQPLIAWWSKTEAGFGNDKAKAVEYARRYEQVMTQAYERGHNIALISIAGLYTRDGVMPNLKKAEELYKLAAQDGVVLAYSYLQLLYDSKDNRGYHNPGEAQQWRVREVAAKGDCGSYPYKAIRALHPAIDILSTPEKAARCYLDAVKRHKTSFFHVVFRNMRSSFQTDHDPIPRTIKMAIQRILRDEGFYSGAIDGDFGTQTYRALEAFKKG